MYRLKIRFRVSILRFSWIIFSLLHSAPHSLLTVGKFIVFLVWREIWIFFLWRNIFILNWMKKSIGLLGSCSNKCRPRDENNFDQIASFTPSLYFPAQIYAVVFLFTVEFWMEFHSTSFYQQKKKTHAHTPKTNKCIGTFSPRER